MNRPYTYVRLVFTMIPLYIWMSSAHRRQELQPKSMALKTRLDRLQSIQSNEPWGVGILLIILQHFVPKIRLFLELLFVQVLEYYLCKRPFVQTSCMVIGMCTLLMTIHCTTSLLKTPRRRLCVIFHLLILMDILPKKENMILGIVC